MPGELKKLRIEAYSSITYSESDKVDEFEVMFNPSTYSEKYEIDYNEDQAQGTSGTAQSFERMPPYLTARCFSTGLRLQAAEHEYRKYRLSLHYWL